MITLEGQTRKMIGTSEDSKPTTNVATNTLFWELDTNDTYYFDGETWVKVGAEASANA